MSHARFAPLQGPRLVRSSQRKGVRVTSQWPVPHGALRQAEPLPHRHIRGSLLGLRGWSAKWRAVTRATRETTATGWSWVSARTRVLALFKSAKAGGAGATWVSARAGMIHEKGVQSRRLGRLCLDQNQGNRSRRQIAGIGAQSPQRRLWPARPGPEPGLKWWRARRVKQRSVVGPHSQPNRRR